MSTNEATVNSVTEVNISEETHEVVFPKVSQRQLAWRDIRDGVLNWRIWLLLAYQDIKLRYRRSVLGPFWITLSMAITVYSMGYLYSHLFHMKVNEYFPYLVAGMLGWSLISTTVTDTVEAFTISDNMLKQIKLPYSLYVHRIVAKNIIIFFHNILVIVPVMILFHDQVRVSWHLLMLFPGLFIIYLNSICFGLVFAMVGGRYRDISQLIKSLIQVVFFVTPIMWKPSILPPSKRFIADLNPVYSYIELVRAPLIGYPLSLTNLIMVAAMSLIGLLACYFIFVSRRARIIYWL